MFRFRGVFAVVFGLLLIFLPLATCAQAGTPSAATLPALTGQVILTVTGLDPATHSGGQVLFDLGRLRAVGQVEFKTSTIWTEGVHLYTGVPLADLVRFLGIAKASLTLHAVNDYDVKMPADEAGPAAPILAYEMDGVPMNIRDKGPIWVIYPYDAGDQYRTDMVFARSVWQLDRIDATR